MEADMASLRRSAPDWSLAGDKQLLDILQNIHQSLVTRCQEVNRKLDEMVLALDGASVDLQNVNNKFMALSNSQFIESRVFDDDVEVSALEQPKEVPKSSEGISELERLKQSIKVLEETHEVIEILNSDTDDSDDDDDVTRIILKPKDMYGHRPLPYIIGSHAWKNKWHAGLLQEDSDSDSSTSKPELAEQYSDSEPEPEAVKHTVTHPSHLEREESTDSSELVSEQDVPIIPQPSGVKPSPSDIAAELARRLGGSQQMPVQEADYSPPPMSSKKVYRPDQPSAGTVFCDEPPPLDQYQSEEETQEEDDIFAELHKSQPYASSNKDQNRPAADPFGGWDIFSDFKDTKTTSTPVAKKSTLFFKDESEPELFADRQTNKPTTQEPSRVQTDAVKKPVGGISLFGNKGTESIGAAILKRNARKSSSDEEASDDVTPLPPQTKNDPAPVKNKEKDIFDDLFAKSEREQKIAAKNKEVGELKKESKVDLFSDNIFDDIDDIFTTNVSVVKKKETKIEKPLFEDDDDIFSEIAAPKDNKVDAKSSSSKKISIFDSDDDLFTDNVKVKESRYNESKPKNFKSSENVDDIFSDLVESKNVVTKSNVVSVASEEVTKNKVPDNEKRKNNNESIFENVKEVSKSTSKTDSFKDNKIPNNNKEKSTKSLFDDEDDELFAKAKSSSNDENSNVLSSSLNTKSDGSSKSHQKSSLFDDESDDNDLFGSSVPKNKDKNTNIKESSKIDNFAGKDKTIINNNVKIQNKSLFDDDDEESDIFATSSKDTNKVPLDDKSNSIDNNSISSHKNDIIIEKNLEQQKSDTKSLFSDNDIDDSNLFSKNDEKPSKITPKPLLKQQKPSLDNQKPVVNEQKPTILQKPLVKEQKPTIKEETPIVVNEKPDKPHLEPVEDKTNVDLTNTLDTKPEIVDIKNTEEQDETVSKSITPEENIVENELFAPKQESNVHNITDNKLDPTIPDFENIATATSDVVKEQETEALFHTPAVFDDIFREPPVFEKSSEPKRSKNVNALFDDDSEDEALFFKKNDATLDEKPDVSSDSNRDALFGIFHDEPPAMDIDFIQKPSKINVNDDFLKSDSDDDLFNVKSKKEDNVPKESDYVKTNVMKTESTDVTTKLTPVLDKAEIFEQKSKTEPKLQRDTTDSETKKVGKLKTMNFNIDVSTLLPGASPKKKAVEQTDGQSISTKSNEDLVKKVEKDEVLSTKSSEDLHSKDKIEHSLLKSVSFDGEPDSKVLDNKLSKERAKIQVKRRPSTRRARKEAVRKSAVDFADDSTDNSSSIDDPPKSRVRPHVVIRHKPKNADAVDSNIETSNEVEIDISDTVNTINTENLEDKVTKIENIETKHSINFEKDIEEVTEQINKDNTSVTEDNVPTQDKNELHISKPIEAKFETDILKDTAKDITDIKSNKLDIANESQSNISRLDDIDHTREVKRTDSKNVTQKIVYILNDEDIFSNPIIEKQNKSKVLTIIDDDDDDLFKNIGTSKSINSVSNISTLGNVYKDTDIQNQSGIENVSKVDISSQSKADIDNLSKINIENMSKVDITNESTENSRNKSLFDDITQKDNKIHGSDSKKVDGSIKQSTVDTANSKFGSRNTSLFDNDVQKDSKTQGSDIKKVDRTKKSLFDDLSEDENELFNPNKKVTQKTKSILDSDSEDDLFGGGRKKTVKETKDIEIASARETKDLKAKVEVKSSLFGDEGDDDDDLFGVRVKNVAASPQPTRSAREPAKKPTELVFDDPLSLLGEDDD